jgi:NAD(P)-dependent dehydrogenase (short-subunit alcohol dehydrogenase family)
MVSGAIGLRRATVIQYPGEIMATYLVTGANRGIGYEYCRQLLARGETPIAVCREASKDLTALGIRVISGIDVTVDEDVASLRSQLQGEPIAVLINNAAIIESVTLADLDFESIRRQFEVNALGPLRVTESLLGNLSAGSKVVLMTSRMGSIDDNTSGSSYGYRMSKVALCMAGKSLSIDLKSQGIAVGILHPGLVQTRMTGFSGITTETAVTGLLARIDGLNLKNTGTFWHSNGEVLPW